MSLSVLNKRFLTLLRELNVDIDQFQDKSFDNLFGNNQSEIGYFLEWFVDNISFENTVTENEKDLHRHLSTANIISDDFDTEFDNSTPSYEILNSLSEDYEKSLVEELNTLDREYRNLQDVLVDLEVKFNSLKSKPNHLKEECNGYRKKINQANEEFQDLNCAFNIIDKDINGFKFCDNCDWIPIDEFKNLMEDVGSVGHVSMNQNFESNTNMLKNVDDVHVPQLMEELENSSCMSVISKSLLEEVKFKLLKAEEFFNKLQDESSNNFTFEETLSVWCDVNELSSYDGLVDKVNNCQQNVLQAEVQKEWNLMWDHYIGTKYSIQSCENRKKIEKYSEYMNLMKNDIVYNILMHQTLHKTTTNITECVKLFDKLYSSISKTLKSETDILNFVNLKTKRYQDDYKHFNEKHALLLSAKKINAGESPDDNMYLNRSCDDVRLMFEDESFYPGELLNRLEERITCGMSSITGPTNQIYMAPWELHYEFSKCRQILEKHSRMVQKILTNYVNVKESTSSDDREQLLLWIDFLLNPGDVLDELENLQAKSKKCMSDLVKT